MKAVYGSTILLGVFALTTISCSHNSDESAKAKEPHVAHDPPTAEQRRAEERAEERRAEERRAEERRAEERKEERYVGGGPGEPSSAVAKVAWARCEREVRCNNIGTKEKYSSRADCVARLQDDKRDDINEKDCPGGIDKKQLNVCISAIRDEACGNPLDSVSRLVSCRSSSMCMK